MPLGERKDPILAFNFRVEIKGIEEAGFSEVSGLQMEIETKDYREGGLNTYVHKLPGPAHFPSNLIMKHGIANEDNLWQWFLEVSKGNIKPKKITIKLLDSAGNEKRQWIFRDAYPVKWVGPEPRANVSDVAVESLEFVHSGLQ